MTDQIIGWREPELGDIVLYTPSPVFPGKLPDPSPAIVTRVHEPWPNTPCHIALEVFGHPENALHRSVPFSLERQGGCWSWRR